MAILQQIFDNHSPVLPHLVTLGTTEEKTQAIRATLEQYFKGTGHALRGLLAMLHPDPDAMHHEFEMAKKVNPLDRDVDSCLDEMKSEINALVEAVERMPRNNDLRWRLGKRYLLMRDYERAAEQFEAFLEMAPENAGAWNNLGVCYKGMQKFDKAVWALNKSLQFDPNLVSAHFNLGEVRDEQGDFSQAVRDYQKVISLRPRYLPAYVNLSRAHFRQREYKQALDAIEGALRLAPENSLLLNLRQSIMRAAEGIEPRRL
jgi:tetratricopeptide (TPR) repeat protein